MIVEGEISEELGSSIDELTTELTEKLHNLAAAIEKCGECYRFPRHAYRIFKELEMPSLSKEVMLLTDAQRCKLEDAFYACLTNLWCLRYSMRYANIGRDRESLLRLESCYRTIDFEEGEEFPTVFRYLWKNFKIFKNLNDL